MLASKPEEQFSSIPSKEKQMAEVFIQCPVKRKSVATGMNIAPSTPAESIPRSVLVCPHCGRFHIWQGKDAFFLNENNQHIPLLQEQG
jgi:hypothetical protein